MAFRTVARAGRLRPSPRRRARRLGPLWFLALGWIAACGSEAEEPPSPGVSKEAPDAGASEAALESAVASEVVQVLEEEVEQLRARVHELEAELEEERQARAQREFDWLEYNRDLARLDVDDLVQQWSVHLPVVDPEPVAPEPEPTPEELARRERAKQLAISLRNLLRLEEVFSLDLLEYGELQTSELLPTALGPVVFRLLDDRGRLTGSLNAQRLRLEGSRAAFTVTLVLEEGFESRGGTRTPFRDGERRIVLPHVRPDRWYDALPELFEADRRVEAGDDGFWNLARVQRDLNARLREDASSGFSMLRRFAGLRDGVFLDVQLVEFDVDGRIERRVFADRMQVLRQETGVQLQLEDGAVMRGDETTPFLEGRYRIFLPRAEHAEWREARLPGFWTPIGAAGEPTEAVLEPSDAEAAADPSTEGAGSD